jgi:hypothetical protein
MFSKTFNCYHLNQTRPGPEHYLRYQAQAQDRADLYLDLKTSFVRNKHQN